MRFTSRALTGCALAAVIGSLAAADSRAGVTVVRQDDLIVEVNVVARGVPPTPDIVEITIRWPENVHGDQFVVLEPAGNTADITFINAELGTDPQDRLRLTIQRNASQVAFASLGLLQMLRGATPSGFSRDGELQVDLIDGPRLQKSNGTTARIEANRIDIITSPLIDADILVTAPPEAFLPIFGITRIEATEGGISGTIIAERGKIGEVLAANGMGSSITADILAFSGIDRVEADNNIIGDIIANFSGTLLPSNNGSLGLVKCGGIFQGRIKATRWINVAGVGGGLDVGLHAFFDDLTINEDVTVPLAIAGNLLAFNTDLIILGQVTAPITIGGDFDNGLSEILGLRIDGGTTSSISIGGDLAAKIDLATSELAVGQTITIGGSLLNDGLIDLGTLGLKGQVIINANNQPGAIWFGNVAVRSPSGQLIGLDPRPQYNNLPSDIGGGAVGFAPYALHDVACTPPNGASFIADDFKKQEVRMRYYGPLRSAVSPPSEPFIVERRQSNLVDPSPWTPVSPGSFTWHIDPASPTELVITESVGDEFTAGFDYRFTPTADLQSDGVTGTPRVLGDPALNPGGLDERYVVSVTDPGGGSGCDSCICKPEQCEFAGVTIGPGPDFDSDGYVGEFDLMVMIQAQGVNGGKADLNGDGVVEAADLFALLELYGQETSKK